mmetsp:Transcript_126768/g.354993  ORF Transcript_126768/g.354993 Transcript_126768/m.354993 type:complete len:255 (-) Transcript_126768:399-1163(-)
MHINAGRKKRATRRGLPRFRAWRAQLLTLWANQIWGWGSSWRPWMRRWSPNDRGWQSAVSEGTSQLTPGHGRSSPVPCAIARSPPHNIGRRHRPAWYVTSHVRMCEDKQLVTKSAPWIFAYTAWQICDGCLLLRARPRHMWRQASACTKRTKLTRTSPGTEFSSHRNGMYTASYMPWKPSWSRVKLTSFSSKSIGRCRNNTVVLGTLRFPRCIPAATSASHSDGHVVCCIRSDSATCSAVAAHAGENRVNHSTI